MKLITIERDERSYNENRITRINFGKGNVWITIDRGLRTGSFVCILYIAKRAKFQSGHRPLWFINHGIDWKPRGFKQTIRRVWGFFKNTRIGCGGNDFLGVTH